MSRRDSFKTFKSLSDPRRLNGRVCQQCLMNKTSFNKELAVFLSQKQILIVGCICMLQNPRRVAHLFPRYAQICRLSEALVFVCDMQLLHEFIEGHEQISHNSESIH